LAMDTKLHVHVAPPHQQQQQHHHHHHHHLPPLLPISIPTRDGNNISLDAARRDYRNPPFLSPLKRRETDRCGRLVGHILETRIAQLESDIRQLASQRDKSQREQLEREQLQREQMEREKTLSLSPSNNTQREKRIISAARARKRRLRKQTCGDSTPLGTPLSPAPLNTGRGAGPLGAGPLVGRAAGRGGRERGAGREEGPEGERGWGQARGNQRSLSLESLDSPDSGSLASVESGSLASLDAGPLSSLSSLDSRGSLGAKSLDSRVGVGVGVGPAVGTGAYPAPYPYPVRERDPVDRVGYGNDWAVAPKPGLGQRPYERPSYPPGGGVGHSGMEEKVDTMAGTGYTGLMYLGNRHGVTGEKERRPCDVGSGHQFGTRLSAGTMRGGVRSISNVGFSTRS